MNTEILRQFSRRVQKCNFFGITFLTFLFLTGCNSQTIFQSNFNDTPINQPPAHIQATGTANVDGPAGSVIIIASPINSSDKFIQIGRQASQQSVSGLQCNFSKFIGDGEYVFTCVLYMPTNSGLATIQFESFGQQVSTLTNFLHLDFTQDNMVRLDDNDVTKFGTFNRNQSFVVQVSLNINDTTQKAHILLSGGGASGEKDYTILPPFRSLAHQFGAVRLWMGFPWTGTFDASTILVTHKIK